MGQDSQSLAISCDWPWVNPILFGCLAKSTISHPMYLGRKGVTHIGKFPPLALPSRWLARRVVFVCFHHVISTPPRLSRLVTSSFTVTAASQWLQLHSDCSFTRHGAVKHSIIVLEWKRIVIIQAKYWLILFQSMTWSTIQILMWVFFVLKAFTVLKFLVLFNLRT